MPIPHLANNAILQLLAGLILGLFIAWLAFRAGSLDRSGMAAAALTGGLIFGLGGLAWAVLLLTFFISSSGLSKMFAQRKAGLSEKFSKGHRRDWGQVAANGGLGALLAVAHAAFPQQIWPWFAFIGAMAAVNADTWATELGVLNRTPPRLITTWRPVERGASGAVSLGGSLAALGGAALIGVMALPFTAVQAGAGLGWAALAAAVVGGVAGSFFDSLLGATVQAIYWCPQCQKETERHPRHICGSQTVQCRGWAWMNNDIVNWIASIVGAMISVLVALV